MYDVLVSVGIQHPRQHRRSRCFQRAFSPALISINPNCPPSSTDGEPPAIRSSRRCLDGFIDRQLLTGVQHKFGDKVVGEIQLRQHFDVTAGVNSNRAESIGSTRWPPSSSFR